MTEINIFKNYFQQNPHRRNESQFWTRSIDQKLTADVVSFIAECIIKLDQPTFQRKEIENSPFYIENFQRRFIKPDPKNAKNESDKFAEQPLNLLWATSILGLENERPKKFSIQQPKLLECISKSDSLALQFLTYHFIKLSEYLPFNRDLIQYVSSLSSKRSDLYDLRDKFIDFIYSNTDIRNKPEPPRKFNKLINVLAFHYKGMGSIGGQPRPVYLDDLLYGRINFRDKNKPKNISRAAFNKGIASLKLQKEAVDLLIDRAKNDVRSDQEYSEMGLFMNDGLNRLVNQHKVVNIMENMKLRDKKGIHVHHIFPKNEFPELSMVKENLIHLNAQEHLGHAHTMGNTQRIDREYQKVCLLAKLHTIEADFKKDFKTYDLRQFIYVLNVGFDFECFQEDDSVEMVREKLENLFLETA